MRFARIAVWLGAAFALTVKLTGQGAVPTAPTPLQASEKQHVMGTGRISVETSPAGRERIQLWLNTPSFLAKEVVLEAEEFSISRSVNGSQVIESTGPVRLTGFALAQGVINTRPFLQNAKDNILTWDRGFKLQILADGTPEWFCCPH